MNYIFDFLKETIPPIKEVISHIQSKYDKELALLSKYDQCMWESTLDFLKKHWPTIVGYIIGFGLVASAWYLLIQQGKHNDAEAVSALFSGLAFVAMLGALLMQRTELGLQRKELVETRKELRKAAEANTTSAEMARRNLRAQYLFFWLEGKNDYYHKCLGRMNVLEPKIKSTNKYLNGPVTNFSDPPSEFMDTYGKIALPKEKIKNTLASWKEELLSLKNFHNEYKLREQELDSLTEEIATPISTDDSA